MKDKLYSIKTPYIDAQALLTLFAGYRKPRERILRMVKRGELIRLKNGFYLIADRIRSDHDTLIPYEQVANLLYGPSYVSLEWALSFYGMIPERVHTITSMSLGRKKEFETQVGQFVYYPLSARRYAVGITQKESANSLGSFLIATPEKALADFVFISCKGLKREELLIELIESKRIDRQSVNQLNKNLLAEIATCYHSKVISYLSDLVNKNEI